MNKILKAIQEGIEQSFIIDPETEDEKFVKSKVYSGLNTTFINKQFRQYVKNLKIDKIVEYVNMYEDILDKIQFKNNKTLGQFLNLFNDLKYSGFSLNWIDTSNITDMSSLLSYQIDFNCDINEWDVSNVTTMAAMFYKCFNFNQPLDKWDVSKVTDMSYMFIKCRNFNQSLNDWDVSNVKLMNSMFNECRVFNQPLDKWDVTNVTDMKYMFQQCFKFDQPLNNWNTCKVTSLYKTFEECNTFNQDLSNWDVSNVIYTSGTFMNCHNFNKPLNSWDVSNVKDMRDMFNGCQNFNQPLDNWNVSNVNNMDNIFCGCSNFDQDISMWNVSKVQYYNDVFTGAKIKDSFKPNFRNGYSFFKILHEGVNQNFMIDSKTEDERFVKSKVSSGLDYAKLQNKFDNLCSECNFIRALMFFNDYPFLSPYVLDDLETVDQYCKEPGFFKCFDISSLIVAIDSNDNEIKLQDIDDTCKIEFFMIKGYGELDDIYIRAKNNLDISDRHLKWCTLFGKLDVAQSKIDGYENSINVKKESEKRPFNLPAIDYCLDKKVQIGDQVYQGYLPAEKQLIKVHRFLEIITRFLKNVMKQSVNDLSDVVLWSSTEYTNNTSYYVYGSYKSDLQFIYKFSKTIDTLPVYRKINN